MTQAVLDVWQTVAAVAAAAIIVGVVIALMVRIGRGP